MKYVQGQLDNKYNERLIIEDNKINYILKNTKKSLIIRIIIEGGVSN